MSKIIPPAGFRYHANGQPKLLHSYEKRVRQILSALPLQTMIHNSGRDRGITIGGVGDRLTTSTSWKTSKKGSSNSRSQVTNTGDYLPEKEVIVRMYDKADDSSLKNISQKNSIERPKSHVDFKLSEITSVSVHENDNSKSYNNLDSKIVKHRKNVSAKSQAGDTKVLEKVPLSKLVQSVSVQSSTSSIDSESDTLPRKSTVRFTPSISVNSNEPLLSRHSVNSFLPRRHSAGAQTSLRAMTSPMYKRRASTGTSRELLSSEPSRWLEIQRRNTLANTRELQSKQQMSSSFFSHSKDHTDEKRQYNSSPSMYIVSYEQKFWSLFLKESKLKLMKHHARMENLNCQQKVQQFLAEMKIRKTAK